MACAAGRSRAASSSDNGLGCPTAPISAVATRANVGLLEMLSTIVLPGANGGHALRHRYLAVVLQALRAPGGGPLPRGPDPAELANRWTTRR